MNQEPVVSICIVNYNSGRYLGSCLDSVIKQTTGITYEIVIVDNHSTDGSVEMLCQNYPMVRMIRNNRNEGFARAANQAVRTARGEYILLLNPDTELVNDAITLGVRSLRESGHQDAVTCRILNPDGSVGVSRKGEHFFSLAAQFFLLFGLHRFFPRSTLYRKALLRDEDFERQRELYFVAGCFLLLRRDYFLEIGLLDESYFLYGEDDDLCVRIRRDGGHILYRPEGEVLHWEKKSSIPLALLPHHYLISTRFHFYRKQIGPIRAILFRAILFVSALVKTVLSLARVHPDAESSWDRKKNNYTWMWALGLKREREP